jgi:alkylhydroperoxidase family enzyme
VANRQLGAVRTVPPGVTANVCRICDARVTAPKRVDCDACFPEQVAAQQGLVQSRFGAAGRAKLQAMREAGCDPTVTSDAKHPRAAGVSKQRKAAIAWRNDGSLDATDFGRDILPRLQGMTLRVIVDALGISHSHALKVRGGKTPSYERHCMALPPLTQTSTRGVAALTRNHKR